MTTPFVRPYSPSSDFEDGLNVFSMTADSSVNQEPALTIGSHIWYRPYVSLSPSTCFVLDDGNGRAVGYCIGTADTVSFAQRWVDDFAATVNPKLVPQPGVKTDNPAMETEQVRDLRKSVYAADCSGLRAWPKVLEEFPAHMHIDILPEFQRQGWGTILINTFLQAVKRGGAKGVHLGMLRANTNARLFYERIGFQVCPQVMDHGESGEKGVEGVVLHMVKSL